MDKRAQLQTLRSEAAEPSTAQFEPASEQLQRSLNAHGLATISESDGQGTNDTQFRAVQCSEC
jgi:hypothetical protein